MPNYPAGSFGPLIDDPNFGYWEERHENNKTGDYIYELGYQASATHTELLRRYMEARATKLCMKHTTGKPDERTGVSLCGDGTELILIDIEINCG